MKKKKYEFLDGKEFLLCVFILLSTTVHHRQLLNMLCLNSTKHNNLIQECKINGWDLQNDIKYKDLVKHKLKEYMNCKIHKQFGKPLSMDEILAILLYTGTSILSDLQSCHRKQNYCKWTILQSKIESAIMKLHSSNMNINKDNNIPKCLYRGMHKVSMKHQKGLYIQPTGFMSTSMDKMVSLFFMSENGCLMQFEDFINNKAIFADIGWLSKYNDEREYLFIPCSIKVLDIKINNKIQIAKCNIYDINEWYLNSSILDGFDFICNFLGIKFDFHSNDKYSKNIQFKYSLPKYTLQNFDIANPPKIILNNDNDNHDIDNKDDDANDISWVDISRNNDLEKRIVGNDANKARKFGAEKPKWSAYTVSNYQKCDQVRIKYISNDIPIIPFFFQKQQISIYSHNRISMLLGQFDIFKALDFAVFSMNKSEQAEFKVKAKFVNEGAGIKTIYLPRDAYLKFSIQFIMCMPIETQNQEFCDKIRRGHAVLKAGISVNDMLDESNPTKSKYDTEYIELDRYCEIVQKWYDQDSNLFNKKQEIRQIGYKIWDKYGIEGMRYVCDKDREQSRYINRIFNGIGTWMG